MVLFLSPCLLSFTGDPTTVSTTDFSYGPWAHQLISLSIKSLPDYEGYRLNYLRGSLILLVASSPKKTPKMRKKSAQKPKQTTKNPHKIITKNKQTDKKNQKSTALERKEWSQKKSNICLDQNLACVWWDTRKKKKYTLHSLDKRSEGRQELPVIKTTTLI